ncbi:unnamed protein product [Protopolystoma xenopodis]|uniref:Uncharacterized protein n=1 Tax=Protopolystoma xenopodis TaxID=117903 RepID=A0A3S5FGW9_9PLAT|nr:unnamed protein product [Protopolystoma xenopodis]
MANTSRKTNTITNTTMKTNVNTITNTINSTKTQTNVKQATRAILTSSGGCVSYAKRMQACNGLKLGHTLEARARVKLSVRYQGDRAIRRQPETQNESA